MLTSDQVAELISQQRETENDLENQTEARRNQQMAALRSVLSKRRKKRMDELRERQEREKMEVGIYHCCNFQIGEYSFQLIINYYLLGSGQRYGPTAQYSQDFLILLIQLNYILVRFFSYTEH